MFFSFRIGLFGFGASASIRDDNKLAGDEGVGNYGLRDQVRALEWIRRFISEFGGNPLNVTLFGEDTGAADIICHLLSASNETRPLFHRAIIQSAIFDYNLRNLPTAGWHLSRAMSTLHVSTLEQLRAIEAGHLIGLGEDMRAIDDGFFFRRGWKESILPVDRHRRGHPKDRSRSVHSKSSTSRQSRPMPALNLPPNLQPLIIGDCGYDSFLWSLPVSFWTPGAIVRRLKAVCQSLAKATTLLCAYDIYSHAADEEIAERVLELVNDARVAWPAECVAQGARRERGGRGVWRYVFDQDGPVRGVPHHAADLIYLFDNMPLPESLRLPPGVEQAAELFFDGPFDVSDDEDEDVIELGVKFASEILNDGNVEEWAVPHVDAWAYTRVRDAIQERWISFAYGEVPWSEDKVYVFGPEGETGERSRCIFERRRRTAAWREVLEPLGMQLVQKVGLELSRGPSVSR
jgi:hypothetical protein